MNKKPRLMTLNDQKREQNRALDRGKKLIGSCFIAVAVMLFSWSSGYPGFLQLGIAAACLGGTVLVHLKQLNIDGFMRWILTAVLFLAALYFGRQGVMISFVASALGM